MNNKKKSSFINTFAWISIVFSGFGIFIGILQNIMMQTVMQDTQFKQLNGEENIPPMLGVMFENFDLLVLGTFIITILTFIASIGLLKRKNWARLFFIALFIGSVIWSIVGGFIQFSMMDTLPNAIPDDVPAEFQNMQNMMKLVMGAITVVMIALYLYLIKKLSSNEIKEEFL